MSVHEQLLHLDINHLGSSHGTGPSAAEDMESGQCSNDECARAAEAADGKH